ncbi:hypothetical protein AD928_03375 [Acetobacter cerevisiae]|uniref:Uncharacterized protein n=1 Tax=Acetobacter cerevisiae TaxID=178900 RepID=A0A149QKP9_9PROT|nr:hypothetical protein AD928_03375 [Acetobacter cerevisiae]
MKRVQRPNLRIITLMDRFQDLAASLPITDKKAIPVSYLLAQPQDNWSSCVVKSAAPIASLPSLHGKYAGKEILFVI